MSTSLRWSLRLVLGSLLALAAMPAAVQAQRGRALPGHPFVPGRLPTGEFSLPMGTFSFPGTGHLTLPTGAFALPHTGLTPAETAGLLHNLNNNVLHTERTAMHDLQQADTFDRGALKDTAVGLLGNVTPLQRAALLNRASALSGAAQNERIAATLAGATPLQKAAVIDRLARVDRGALDTAAVVNGIQRLALSSAYNGGYNSNPYMQMPFGAGYGTPLVGNNPYTPTAGGSGGGYGGYGGGYSGMYLPTPGGSGTGTNSTATGSTSLSNPTGSGTGWSNPYAVNNATEQASSSPLLDAIGVPTSNGHVNWPLGLRVLTPTSKADALRSQLDGIVQLAAANGKLSKSTVELATDAADQLRSMLRQKRGAPVLAESTYRDATSFLDRLEVSLLALK